MRSDFAPEHVWRASMAIKPYCVNCGCTDGPSELLHTGDEDSLEGWEVWFSCDDCRNDGQPNETFFRVKAKAEEGSDAGGWREGCGTFQSTTQGSKVMNWMPIDAAPMDGTAVLVMRDIWPGTKSGRAEECNAHNTYVAAWWAGERAGRGAWICYMDAVFDPECPIEPTHWMPLPSPPSAT